MQHSHQLRAQPDPSDRPEQLPRGRIRPGHRAVRRRDSPLHRGPQTPRQVLPSQSVRLVRERASGGRDRQARPSSRTWLLAVRFVLARRTSLRDRLASWNAVRVQKRRAGVEIDRTARQQRPQEKEHEPTERCHAGQLGQLADHGLGSKLVLFLGSQGSALVRDEGAPNGPVREWEWHFRGHENRE